MARVRKLKDEDFPAVVYFTDGSSVQTERRSVSTISNTLYFETAVSAISPKGASFMTTRTGNRAWAVPIGEVTGVK